MKILKDKVECDLTIDTDTKISGLVSGNVQVIEGTELFVSGLISGNLTISQNAYVKVNGMVSGDVNNNGEIDVYGMVTGNITNFDGIVTIHKDAMVNGKKY
ncbi:MULTISPECIES: polymer-forming cytoskeletal protein [Lysinibacillus]|uniref:Polymer-forming cytoskeletal protein n=1 Tax=Lysinibacillus capsici TaxID=2115968 RepID=A0ABY8KL93_9BACI|nr:polymer-forming cytoskeletal protein [Lysinibacillus capsici]WGF40243.1 polymer-forming cytoskeletal protein [Lysinibacillus capsici]